MRVYVFICKIALTATRSPTSTIYFIYFSITKFKSRFLIWFDKVILKPLIYCQLRLINRRECVYETNAHIREKKTCHVESHRSVFLLSTRVDILPGREKNVWWMVWTVRRSIARTIIFPNVLDESIINIINDIRFKSIV